MTLKEGPSSAASPDVGKKDNGSVMPSTSSTGPSNTFESFYHGVCSELQSKGEVHSVSKIFSHFETDQDRMRFVLEKGEKFGCHLDGLTSFYFASLIYSTSFDATPYFRNLFLCSN